MPSVLALHGASALVLAGFVLLHLAYHAVLFFDVAAAFELMRALRVIYRWWPVEALVLASALVQVVTGPLLARRQRGAGRHSLATKLSGYYLLFFIVIHVVAVLWGRVGMHLDTTIHFAAAGLHAWPSAAFFGPYYFLAVVAVFVHVGRAICRRLAGTSLILPLAAGLACASLILAGMAGIGNGLVIPEPYMRAVR